MLESLLYQWNLLQRNTLYFTSPGRGSIPVDFCKSKCALSYKLRPFNFFFHFNLNFNFKIDLVHEERIFLLPQNNPTSLVREMNAHFSLVPHPPERPSKEIPVPPPGKALKRHSSFPHWRTGEIWLVNKLLHHAIYANDRGILHGFVVITVGGAVQAVNQARYFVQAQLNIA